MTEFEAQLIIFCKAFLMIFGVFVITQIWREMMTNKECIERLRFIKAGSNNHKSTIDAIDHAIARLEMLDRLEELLEKAQKVNDYRYLPYKSDDWAENSEPSILIGQDEILVAVREFLTGDDKALKILAEGGE